MFSKLLYQEIEDYALNSLCKEGTSGALFKAIHRKNQNVCAIKILDLQRLSLHTQEKGVEDFLSYLKILEKIKHPGIVTILNSGRYQQFIWIAEEWIEGLILRNFLERNSRVEIASALKWTESCLNALDFLYQKDLKHNNLKPENIWLVKDGSIKISGMGLGSDIVDVEKCNDLNLKVLDPHYLAPEQILKQKSDIRADLYVLATIFYEMVTGHALYDASFPHFIMQYHINGIPSTFFQENSEIPEEILAWLIKLLAKYPQDRFLNPAEFRPILKKTLSSFPKDDSIVSQEESYQNIKAKNLEDWDIPVLDIPDEIKTVRKTQPLPQIPNTRATRSMPREILDKETRVKPASLSKNDKTIDAHHNYPVEVEVVRVSKEKKLPFQPAVFGEAPLSPSPELPTPNFAPLDNVTPLPRDFITEHRHSYHQDETDTGIRVKAGNYESPFPKEENIRPDSFLVKEQGKIDTTQKLVNKKKKTKKETKHFKKNKKNINYFFIFSMTLITIAVFFVWYRIESTPTAANQPKIVPRPKIIYKITENLGWFGEKLPKGLVRAEKRGEYICKKDDSIMLYVPQGTFWRGDEKGKQAERPERKVNLGGFYIDKYELTNAQYLRFVEETGYNPPAYIAKQEFSSLRQPVVGINWYDAQRYAKWAEKRLPTEAEWEKSSRGGLTIPDWEGQDIPIKLTENPLPKRIYPWGNEKPEQRQYMVSNYKNKSDNYIYPASVTAFSEGMSPYGCMNMSGNVWELCNDKFDPEFYNTLIYTDPTGPSDETIRQRACRGGSWGSDETQITCFNRFSVDANYKGNSVGVRLAKSMDYEK